MDEYPIERVQVISAVQGALAANEAALAFWEGGSRAMGHADALSDLDLQILVRDGGTVGVRQVVEQALLALSPFDGMYEVPRPTWHGHWQAFYRLRDASPFLLIDLVIMEESSPNRFLETEIHGTPVVFLDKRGDVRAPAVNAAAFAAQLARRLPLLETPAELMHNFIDKELQRGRPVDALAFYQSVLIVRLVEALRMRHCPWRYNFGMRYLQRDLPPALYETMRGLVYVADPQRLPEQKAIALALLRETVAELKRLDLAAHLELSREP